MNVENVFWQIVKKFFENFTTPKIYPKIYTPKKGHEFFQKYDQIFGEFYCLIYAAKNSIRGFYKFVPLTCMLCGICSKNDLILLIAENCAENAHFKPF